MISLRNLEVPMPRVEARQKRQDRGEAEAITSRPRQGRGNNHDAEARPERGTKTKRQGETEAALLPRDSHTSLVPMT